MYKCWVDSRTHSKVNSSIAFQQSTYYIVQSCVDVRCSMLNLLVVQEKFTSSVNFIEDCSAQIGKKKQSLGPRSIQTFIRHHLRFASCWHVSRCPVSLTWQLCAASSHLAMSQSTNCCRWPGNVVLLGSLVVWEIVIHKQCIHELP